MRFRFSARQKVVPLYIIKTFFHMKCVINMPIQCIDQSCNLLLYPILWFPCARFFILHICNSFVFYRRDELLYGVLYIKKIQNIYILWVDICLHPPTNFMSLVWRKNVVLTQLANNQYFFLHSCRLCYLEVWYISYAEWQSCVHLGWELLVVAGVL